MKLQERLHKNKEITEVFVCDILPLLESAVLGGIASDLPETRRDENLEFPAQRSEQAVRICQNTCFKGS